MNELTIPVNETDHIQHNPLAPIILVEYGDYECPYCGEAYPIIKKIQQTLSDDLAFVFRNFPLSEAHPNALNAAYAAESAGLQDKFWEMHDILYENQNNLQIPDLFDYARDLELSLEQFEKDFSSEQVKSKVHNDFIGGIRSGVNGTPTFYINGSRYDGYYGYDNLLHTLRREINNE
jgi:protein-disulfide isomerase